MCIQKIHPQYFLENSSLQDHQMYFCDSNFGNPYSLIANVVVAYAIMFNQMKMGKLEFLLLSFWICLIISSTDYSNEC